MNKKLFRIFGIILIIIGLSMVGYALLNLPKAHASSNKLVIKLDCDIDGDPFDKNEAKECRKPTPTPTPTIAITPTATPTATPTSTPSVVAACTGNCGGWSPAPQGSQSTTNPPAPVVCTIPFTPPVINKFTAKGNGTVNFGWLESDQGVTRFSIIYGYSPDKLVYGQDTIPAGQSGELSVDINFLQPGQSVFAEIYAWKNGCAETSNLFDPKVR